MNNEIAGELTGEIQVVIDGKETRGQEDMTILSAAQQIGIEIPTLCYSPDLSPTGACRICVVEVEGSRMLVGACHTPIEPGMIIHTHSPKVLAARRAVVELLQAAHDAVCVTDPTCQRCDLHKLCSDLQVRRAGFPCASAALIPSKRSAPMSAAICPSVFCAAGASWHAVKSQKRMSTPQPIEAITPRL